jgi:hypothetical protein
MPGMLAMLDRAPPLRIVEISDAGNALQEARWLPDLSDPATRGWLLELVREAWGDPRLTTRCRAPLRVSGDADSGFADGPWDIVSASENVTISILGACGATEAEALVAALEAAP